MKRALLPAVLAATALAGCGFQPLYGNSSTVAALSRVEVGTIQGRTGFLLREQLDDQLARDRSRPARYRLEATLAEFRNPYGGRVNNVASRYNLNLDVQYRLFDTAAAREIKRGAVNAQVGYDSSDPPYAGVVAAQTAEERAAASAAVQIRLDLARYFGGLPPQ